MKIKTLAIIAATAAACCLGSCKEETSISDGTFRPTRIDIAGASALSIIDNGSRSRATEGDFDNISLFKIDDAGNLSAVSVFLVTDKDGNTSSKEVETKITAVEIAPINDTYFALIACIYLDEDNEPIYDMPELYSDLIVRKSDGRIFAAGGIRPFYAIIRGDYKVLNLTQDKFYMCAPGFDTNLMCLIEFRNGELMMQEQDSEGIVYSGNAIYSDGKIFSSEPEIAYAGVWFENSGYDYFHGDSFAPEEIISYMTLHDGLAAISTDNNILGSTLTFSMVDTPAPGEASLREIAKRNGLYSYRLDAAYESEGKILLQERSYDGNINDYVTSYSVITKADGSWTDYEPAFGAADGMRLSADRLYNGRLWGIERGSHESYKSRMLWINPTTLESGTVDIDTNLSVIDVKSSEEYYTLGKLTLYGTRRTDKASVVLDIDIASGHCNEVTSFGNHEFVKFLPLN